MKYLYLILVIATCLALPARAQTPTPTQTIPNVLSTNLPGGGSLFTRQSPVEIRFPNLITMFTNNVTFVNDAFGFIVGLLSLAGGVIVFGYMIYGGVKYITSAGNPAMADEGRKTVAGAVVGSVIVMLSYLIVLYIRSLFV